MKVCPKCGTAVFRTFVDCNGMWLVGGDSLGCGHITNAGIMSNPLTPESRLKCVLCGTEKAEKDLPTIEEWMEKVRSGEVDPVAILNEIEEEREAADMGF